MERGLLVRWGRRLLALGLLLAAAGTEALSAQTAPPEEPEWSRPDAGATGDLPAPAVPDPAAAADPAPATDAASPDDLPDRSDDALETTSAAPPADGDAIGVPQSSNSFLPYFAGELDGRPFFERDGLRFRAGPVNLRLALSLSTEYNDNIYSSAYNPVADQIQRITPELTIGMGDFAAQSEDYLSMQYSPDFAFYLHNPDQNRVNQSLVGSAMATFSRYSTVLYLSYIDANTPSATQSGGQSYQTLTFNWNNSYSLTEKTFTRLNLSALYQAYEDGGANTTYTASPLLGYQYSPKTVITIGPYAGVAYLNGGQAGSARGTQTFQGATIGFQYDNLRKLQLNGTVGFQSRQFEGDESTGSSNFTTPIFQFDANYALSTDIGITAGLSRTVEITNLVEGQTYTNNAFSLGYRQDISSHFSWGLTFGYQYLEYDGETADGRTDQFATINPSVSYKFWRDQCALSVFYSRQQRTSTVSAADFSVNVYGIRFTYKF